MFICLLFNFLSLIQFDETEFKNNATIIYDLIFNEKYRIARDEALKLTQAKDFSKKVSGYILLHDVNSAFDETYHENKFANENVEIQMKLEILLKNHNYDYFNGLISVQKLFTYSNNNSYFKMYFESNNLEKYFTNSIKNNELASESKYYLSNYNYWKGKKLNIIFSNDKNKKNIIENSYKLINENSYLQNITINNLIWIYFSENDFENMEKTIKLGLEKYPLNTNYLWALMTLYEKIGTNEKLLKILHQILSSLDTKEFVNYYALITCKLKIAQILFDDKNYGESKKILNEIINYKKNNNIIGFNDKLEIAKKLYFKIK